MKTMDLFESRFLQRRIDEYVKEHGSPPMFLMQVMEENGEEPYVRVREVNGDNWIKIPINHLLIHYWVTEYGLSGQPATN